MEEKIDGDGNQPGTHGYTAATPQSTKYPEAPINPSTPDGPVGNIETKYSGIHADHGSTGQQSAQDSAIIGEIKKGERWMIVLTCIIAFATAANVLVFYLESESTSHQIDTLADRMNSVLADRINQVIGNVNWLAREMNYGRDQSLASAKASADSAQRALGASIRNAETDQRAWLGTVDPIVEGRGVYVKAGEILRFSVHIKNFGRTPALHYKSAGGLMLLERGRDLISDPTKTPPSNSVRGPNNGLGSDSVLQPGAVLIDAVGDDEEPLVATTDTIRKLSNGDLTLYVFGRIDYSDIFKKPHFTTFCIFLSRDLAHFTDYRRFNTAN